jgi:hypothetical protein
MCCLSVDCLCVCCLSTNGDPVYKRCYPLIAYTHRSEGLKKGVVDAVA